VLTRSKQSAPVWKRITCSGLDSVRQPTLLTLKSPINPSLWRKPAKTWQKMGAKRADRHAPPRPLPHLPKLAAAQHARRSVSRHPLSSAMHLPADAQLSAMPFQRVSNP